MLTNLQSETQQEGACYKFSARGQGRTIQPKTEDEAITELTKTLPRQAPTRPPDKQHLIFVDWQTFSENSRWLTQPRTTK